MKLYIEGAGPLYEQAKRLADAAGLEVVGNAAEADHILPATEDDGVLSSLGGSALFDPRAWEICSSRFASDDFMREHGIPIPAYFPEAVEPYFIKPDRGSFGRGIALTDDYCEVGGAVNAGFVAQEELTGDVWSVAVIGRDGAYTVYPAAKLTRNDFFRRTGAECVPAPDADALNDIARSVAEAMGLRGVLEVEAMHHLGAWKVTDLNARLPMLSSDALLAQGVNLLEALIEAYS